MGVLYQMDIDNKKLNKAIGQAVREIRHPMEGERNFSQEKLADICGFDRTYISSIERGLKAPTLKTIITIALALKKEPWELVKRTTDLYYKN